MINCKFYPLGVPYGTSSFKRVNLDTLASGALQSGANALTGGLAGALVSGIGSLFGLGSGNEAQKQFERQAQLQREAQAWQSNENQLSRSWQSDEAKAMRDWQHDEWLSQFDAQNAYNDPSAQVKRLNNAGLNAAAMFGQNGSTGNSAMPAVAAAPSVPSPGMSSSPLGSVALGRERQELLSHIGNLASSLSQLPLNAANENRLNTLIATELDNYQKQGKLTEAQTFYYNALEQLNSIHIPAKLKSEIALNLKKGELYIAQGDLYKAQKLLTDLEKDGQRIKNNTARLDYAYLIATLNDRIDSVKKSNQLLDAQIVTEKGKPAVQKSEIANNYASAKEHISQANYNEALTETENALRSGRLTGQQLANGCAALSFMLTSNDLHVSNATLENRVKGTIAQWQSYDLINQRTVKEIHRLARENKWIHIDKIITNIGRVAAAYRDVGIGANALIDGLEGVNPVPFPIGGSPTNIVPYF